MAIDRYWILTTERDHAGCWLDGSSDTLQGARDRAVEVMQGGPLDLTSFLQVMDLQEGEVACAWELRSGEWVEVVIL